MKKYKLTSWIPAEQKPVRPGVYEVQGVMYPFHYFDGKRWLNAAEARPEAFHGRDMSLCDAIPGGVTYIKNRPWRGLADPVGAQQETK